MGSCEDPLRVLDRITAVVVTFNDAVRARACVEALSGAGVAHIIIWDNSEDPAARAAITELDAGPVSVIGAERNLGFGAGNNRAAQRVRTPLIAFVNPDCVVTTDALIALARRASHPGVGVVAPKMRYADGTYGFAGGGRPSLAKEAVAAARIDDSLPRVVRSALIRSFEVVGRCFGRGYGLASSKAGTTPIPLHWVSGFCMVVPTHVFTEVGGFDESFFLYFEDVDLCERITALGYDVILERSVDALHFESTSTGLTKSAHYWSGLANYYRIRGANTRAGIATILGRRLK